MGNTIKVVLIGCGAIAPKHVTAVKRITDLEISGAYDISASAAKALSAKFGVRPFTEIDELVEKAKPDVFVILTPSGNHANDILKLITYGKHFVVEKPLALRLDDIDTILNACDKAGVKIFVVKQNRFNPPIRMLKEAIDQGRFGRLVIGTVRVRWCRDQAYYDQKSWRRTWACDEGVLTNQASHHIDMLIWMMGEVESVIAKTATRLVNIEAEDTGVAILKFKNGALGIVEATTGTRPKDLEGSISVLGEKGAVEVGGFFMNELKTWNFSEKNAVDDVIWDRYASVPAEQAWNHTEFYKNIVESLRENKRGLIDGLEGRKSVELINGIYESAETGKEVFIHVTSPKCRVGMQND